MIPTAGTDVRTSSSSLFLPELPKTDHPQSFVKRTANQKRCYPRANCRVDEFVESTIWPIRLSPPTH